MICLRRNRRDPWGKWIIGSGKIVKLRFGRPAAGPTEAAAGRLSDRSLAALDVRSTNRTSADDAHSPELPRRYNWVRCGHSSAGAASSFWCNGSLPCVSPWFVISDPAQGLTYRSDINFDSKIDGSDLAQVLNDWGNAPRQDIVPSTCPLNLINP